MTVSAAEQYELATGTPLLMGTGTVYKVRSVSGLGMPPLRVNDLPLPTLGSFAARDVVGPRTIGMQIAIAADPATLMASLTTFLTAWQSANTDIKFTFRLTGQSASRYVFGRPRMADLTWNPDEGPRGNVTIPVSLFCQIPTIRLTSGDTVTVL